MMKDHIFVHITDTPEEHKDLNEIYFSTCFLSASSSTAPWRTQPGLTEITAILLRRTQRSFKKLYLALHSQTHWEVKKLKDYAQGKSY